MALAETDTRWGSNLIGQAEPRQKSEMNQDATFPEHPVTDGGEAWQVWGRDGRIMGAIIVDPEPCSLDKHFPTCVL